MAYTPDPEDTAQPTGNKAVSTAAPEFRALKAYIRSNLEDQDERDDAQDAAIALVQTNLNAVVAAQDARDDAQDVAISTAQVAANFALAYAEGKHSCHRLATTSGNWLVPTGVTEVFVYLSGGGSAAGAILRDAGVYSISFYSQGEAGAAAFRRLAVIEGSTIPFSRGFGQVLLYQPGSGGFWSKDAVVQLSAAGETTFGSLRARPAVSFYGYTPAAFNTEANTAFVYSNRADRGIPTLALSQRLAVGVTDTLQAGSNGEIMLFY